MTRGDAASEAVRARRLLDQRDALRRRLAVVDAALEQSRRTYRDARGFTMLRQEAFELEVRG